MLGSILALVLAAVTEQTDNGGGYIPKASEKAIQISPMRTGEAAWSDNEDGATASMWIGTDCSFPIRVSDTSALRGRRTYRLSKDEYSVSAGSEWTYDGEKYVFETYDSGGPTGTIQVVTCYDHAIEEFEPLYTTYRTDGGFDVAMCFRTQVEVSGNIATIKFWIAKDTGPGTPGQPVGIHGGFVVNGFKIIMARFGDGDGVNDLSETKFTLKDSLGTVDFYNLRSWAKILYNGHRAEHWSNFQASNTVRLAGHRITFDEHQRYHLAFSPSVTNIAFTASGIELMSLYADGGGARTNDYRALAVTAFDLPVSVETEGAFISFYHDITGYNQNDLTLEASGGMENGADGDFFPLIVGRDWEFASGVQDTIFIHPEVFQYTLGKKGFFRLHYNRGSALAARVDFGAPVHHNKGLYLEGEDGIEYKITVSNGVISATPVTE